MKYTLVILFLLLPGALWGQSDIQVLSSNTSELILEYTPSVTGPEKIIAGSTETLQFLIRNTFSDETRANTPQLPQRFLPVGVPSEYGTTIEIVDTAYITYNAVPSPVPKYEVKDSVHIPVYSLDYQAYSESKLRDPVTFGSFGYLGFHPVQTLLLNPIQYDASSGQIVLYTKIKIKITFPAAAYSKKKSPPGMLSMLCNGDIARGWMKKTAFNKAHSYDSKLTSGKWVRFETSDEGFYKITYEMLSAFGIDAANVDPRTIKIYNNGGKELPENVHAERNDDLTEIAIRVSGEEDGSFDSGDYILFYGRGIHFYDYAESSQIERFYNHYAKANYYWITAGGEAGKRIGGKESLHHQSYQIQTTTAAYIGFEEDLINLGRTGRNFFGDEFSVNTKQRTYINKLSGLIEEKGITYSFRFANASSDNLNLLVEENGNVLTSEIVPGFGSNTYLYGRAIKRSIQYGGNITNERSALQFTLNTQSSNHFGYLDYFEIQYFKSLKADVNDILVFYSLYPGSVTEYRLHNFSNTNIIVYDITDPANVKEVTDPVLKSGGEFRFQYDHTIDGRGKFYAYCTDRYAYLMPSNPVEVPNQNLHGISPGAEYVIITHKDFLSQAERLAQYRQNDSPTPLTCSIVTSDQIINEFGCGIPDPTAIRNFLSYAYENWAVKPEYAILLGKGHYNYKGINETEPNYVPTIETLESLDEIDSYCYDDYFGWVSGEDHIIDIAVGRIPAASLTEVKQYIDKVIAYESGTRQGNWKNRIVLVADDQLTSTGFDPAPNTQQSETLSNDVLPGSYQQDKIYLATYPTVMTSFGRRKPEVNEAIIEAINEGTLLLNFIGHGNPELWTHEQVFVSASTIPLLNNTEYFFLTAATCGFGYFDDPQMRSGMEQLLVKNRGGAIGGFTASRPVISQYNAALNEEFYRNILQSDRDTLNLPVTLGEAYGITKITHSNTNDIKFHLFGDPALRLQLPQYRGAIDSINGTAPGTGTIQIKALSRVDISGSVLHPESGLLWGDYNGEGLLTLFDSKYEIPLPEISSTQTMTLQDGIIFRGRVSVNGGRYNASFIVPKDILYENQQGKALIYFYNEQGDGIGYTDELIVGGTDTTSVNDGNGPEIDIYFDDPAYERGYLVNVESSLIIRLSDETGLNTTGTGIGHNLEGYLDGDESAPIDLTPYFTGDTDSGGKSGSIEYRFAEITPGYHTLSVQAWDVYNNVSREEISFEVVDDAGLQVSYVMNYPNPFSDETYFTFQQNLSRPLDVRILIYTVSGRKINEIERLGVYEKFVKIGWDGRDKDGDHLANGTYLYKVIVKTVDGEFTETVLGKLAVIR